MAECTWLPCVQALVKRGDEGSVDFCLPTGGAGHAGSWRMSHNGFGGKR